MQDTNAFAIYSQHRNMYVFKTAQGSVLFKLLDYNKVKIAEKICNAYPSLAPTIEDNIWEECVIEHSFPYVLDDLNAGIVSTVVRVILRMSIPATLDEVEKVLQEARDQNADIRDDIIIKICQAFPAYKPEEVEGLDWQMQLKRLSQAEKILNIKFEIGGASATPKQEFIDFEKENRILNSL